MTSTEIRLSVTVMAHPARSRFVEPLIRALGNPRVEWDRGRGLWDTARRAWLSYDENAEWHLVVQDDAVLCDGFIEAASSALRNVSSPRPVSFYTGSPRPHPEIVGPVWEKAVTKGIPWVEMEGPWWGVAFALPIVDVERCISWSDAWDKTYRDERRIAAWYAQRGVRCWYTVPCLADHRDERENPSLIEGHTGRRRARWFAGDGAEKIDWSKFPLVETASVSYP